MQIWIASDHGGFELKKMLWEQLRMTTKFDVHDLGCYTSRSCDYPDYAKEVCRKVSENGTTAAIGILVCSTGQGMAMTANSCPGIRAALVYNTDIAQMCREHNDANVICLGSKFISQEQALKCVNMFIDTAFSKEPRHQRRVNKIK